LTEIGGNETIIGFWVFGAQCAIAMVCLPSSGKDRGVLHQLPDVCDEVQPGLDFFFVRWAIFAISMHDFGNFVPFQPSASIPNSI
jgi:hypothetical protein